MGCVSMRCSLVLSRWYNLIVEGIVGLCHILLNQIEDVNADAFEAHCRTFGGIEILGVDGVRSIFNPGPWLGQNNACNNIFRAILMKW